VNFEEITSLHPMAEAEDVSEGRSTAMTYFAQLDRLSEWLRMGERKFAVHIPHVCTIGNL
jgi:hypothetical protein